MLLLASTEEDAAAALAALQAPTPAPPSAEPRADDTITADTGNDTTFAANTTTATTTTTTSAQPKGIMKKKQKTKLTAKEKKERGIAIDKVISVLPLEFRGNDPNLRRNMENVIEGMLDRENRGVSRKSPQNPIPIFCSSYLLNLFST